MNKTFINNYLNGNVLQGQGIYLHLTVVVLDTGNSDFIVKSGFLEWVICTNILTLLIIEYQCCQFPGELNNSWYMYCITILNVIYHLM